MTTVRQNIYSAYLDGDAMPMETLRSLCADYEELDDSYKQFSEMRDTAREQIGHIVARDFANDVDVPGFGRLLITAPSFTKGYDSAALDGLIDSLADDYPHIASQIAGCRKKTMRSGGLRIERARP